jgi:kynureninase
MPQRLGDKLAPLVGARPGELVICDSTSVNLYKALHTALSIARQRDAKRTVIVSERSNFPTDNYIAQGLAKERGFTLKLVEKEEVAHAIDTRSAVLMLTHVNYRTGAMHDMAAVTAHAHANGALVVWDLAHSAGAVPVDLHAADADFAVGCCYKYLNGGPGAPAFVWVHPRHVAVCGQPLTGWYGHRAPFAFTPDYQPSADITRYLTGTPPMLSLATLECGLDIFHATQTFGGMQAIRQKSLALTDLFITLIEQRVSGHDIALVTPRPHAERGSQVCFTHPSNGYAIVQAMIARGVIGDFRTGEGGSPDILRFGFAPLYNTFEEVWHAVEHLRQVMETREWAAPQFKHQHAVT